MKDNKSLVQEALIQMKQVEEAIAENAKGILQSTMKEEISQLVKESLTEQGEEDGIEIKIGGWKRESKNGNRFISLQVDTYVKKEEAKPPQADKDEWEF
jgi:hypothetical protein